MTVTQTPSTGSVNRWFLGDAIYQEDMRELLELQNWVAGNRPCQHISTACGEPGWGTSGNEVGLIFISGTQGQQFDYVSTDIFVSRNAMTGGIAATGDIRGTGDRTATANFIFTGSIGLVTSSLTFDSTTDRGIERSGSVNWNEIGYGWVNMKINFNTAGTTATAWLTSFRVEDLPVTSSAGMAARPPATGSLS